MMLVLDDKWTLKLVEFLIMGCQGGVCYVE